MAFLFFDTCRASLKLFLQMLFPHFLPFYGYIPNNQLKIIPYENSLVVYGLDESSFPEEWTGLQ
jgi:hypothetical protein